MMMLPSMFRTEERIGHRDIAIAVIFSIAGVALMYSDTQDPQINASWLAVPLFLAVTVPVAWRREAPLAAMLTTFVALAINVALFGTITRCGVVFPLVWVIVFAAAARLPLWPSLLALALGIATDLLMAGFDHQVTVTAAIPFGGLTTLVWGAGRIARSRGRLAEQLRVRTEELRAVRDERTRLEVATDRARLSAELDSLVQRRLGELAVAADAGALERDPRTATATLATIERESRATLEEMRELVGVLRHDDDAFAPQPTLASLDALVLRAKGADARLTVEGSPRALPAGVELSAYRIVEHLLDAVGDAPGVTVGVRFGDNEIEVAVSGPASRRRDVGAAIERARERAQLHRGHLEARVAHGRAEAVAELPLLAGV